jgi:aromatic ring-opening dioxygenase LigB subunit
VAEDTQPPAGVLEDFRLDIGSRLAEFIEKIPEKVVFIVSGDLSHCYQTNHADPLYLPDPYL